MIDGPRVSNASAGSENATVKRKWKASKKKPWENAAFHRMNVSEAVDCRIDTVAEMKPVLNIFASQMVFSLRFN